MIEAPRRPRRAIVLLAAATSIGGAGLAGCATDQAGGTGTAVSPAAATDSPSSTSGSGSSPSPAGGASSTEAGSTGSATSADLSAGLLPESEFGDDAEVHTWSGSGDHHGFPWWGDGDHWPDVSVDPDSCGAALQKLTDGLDDDADLDTASRTALASDTVTVETLVQGAVPSVDQLRDALTACPTASIGGPGPWQVTFTISEVDVPALGDGSLAVRTEVDASGAKHHHWDDDGDEDGHEKRSALMGVAQDGNRLVVLVSTREDGAAADEAAFRDLFQRAFQVQKDALD